MDYPKEWDQLPRHERRKKFKMLRREKENKTNSTNNMMKIGAVVVLVVIAAGGFKVLTKKSPEQIELQQKIETVSLDGKVEEFMIEGSNHVSADTNVEYKTNPPTSGAHFSQAKNWGVYDTQIEDKTAVHGLEHGGIWISYKDIDDETKQGLEEIGRANPLSVIVSPRTNNDHKIVVASWGKMMILQELDKAAIQKYIETYKNNSPEQLAR